MNFSLPKKLASFAIKTTKVGIDYYLESANLEHKPSPFIQDLLEELTPFQRKVLRVIVKTLKQQEIPSMNKYMDEKFPLELPKKDIDAIKNAFSKIADHARVTEELKDIYAPESNQVSARKLTDLQPGDSFRIITEDNEFEELLIFKKSEGLGGEFFIVTPRQGGPDFNQNVKLNDLSFFSKVDEVKRPTIRSILSFARKSEWGKAVLQPMFEIQYPLRALAQSEDIQEELDCEDLDLLIDGALGKHGLSDEVKSRKWLLVTLFFIAKNRGITVENKEKRIESTFKLIAQTEPQLIQDLPQVRKLIKHSQQTSSISHGLEL
ncbi:MAG: hypothetical protein R3A13_07930 [Bdellovibrionota bacterium]